MNMKFGMGGVEKQHIVAREEMKDASVDSFDPDLNHFIELRNRQLDVSDSIKGAPEKFIEAYHRLRDLHNINLAEFNRYGQMITREDLEKDPLLLQGLTEEEIADHVYVPGKSGNKFCWYSVDAHAQTAKFTLSDTDLLIDVGERFAQAVESGMDWMDLSKGKYLED